MINNPLSKMAILGHLPLAACSEGDGCAVGFAKRIPESSF